MRIPASETRLMTRIAWLYYIEGATQQMIGDRLGLSRIKVNRLLQQARAEGLIQFVINTPDVVYVELEQALCRRFNLIEAVVVEEADLGEPLYMALAQGVADWLNRHLVDGMSVGLSMGRTISHLPQVFRPKTPIDCAFAEIIGGASDYNGLTTYNITSKMAEIAGGRASYIYAPTIVSSAETRSQLLKEPSIAAALERARQCEAIVQSVGPVDETALLYLHGYFTEADLAELREHGAVGDMLGHYFDIEGQPVHHPLEDRIITLTLDEMCKIPYNIVAAGGKAKVDALRGALRGTLFNVLVTDAHTAQLLLKEG